MISIAGRPLTPVTQAQPISSAAISGILVGQFKDTNLGVAVIKDGTCPVVGDRIITGNEPIRFSR